jgi:hypothetical protein
MKPQLKQHLAIILTISTICIVDCLATSFYWQHQAVLHNAAFYEANSWGKVSFHWNDVSFAQTPFQ